MSHGPTAQTTKLTALQFQRWGMLLDEHKRLGRVPTPTDLKARWGCQQLTVESTLDAFHRNGLIMYAHGAPLEIVDDGKGMTHGPRS